MTGSFDPDAWQADLDAPRRHDDEPVNLSYFQVVKCAAIVSAFAQGHENYRGPARHVVNFLQTTAMEVLPGWQTRPTSEEQWARLADVPWPLVGPPRRQPDVDST